jgi:hypothetical protein
VRSHEDRAIVGEERRLRPDDLEEAGDVLELLLGGRRVGADEAGQDPARAQEPIQQLPRWSRVCRLRVAAQVRDESMDRGPGYRSVKARMLSTAAPRNA